MNAVRYMTRNRVVANLLMLVFLGGGIVASQSLLVEVFPEIELDRVLITMDYPGASPDEVEQGVVRPIEEAVYGIEGVRRLQAAAAEARGNVVVEALENADIDTVVQDVKAAVDRITTFPETAERPVVRKVINRRAVLSVVVYGDLAAEELRGHAEELRDGLLALPEITQAELKGVPPYEISIEVPEAMLRRHALTLPQIARIVRAASVDLPGGEIETAREEILLRTKERRYTAQGYRSIVVVAEPDGTLLRLGDIARVRDILADTDVQAQFNGQQAAMVEVFRIGDQSPGGISEAVRRYLEQRNRSSPTGVKLAVLNDRSELLQSRLALLERNALIGLTLVILVLGLFLAPRVAFWVTFGIAISMLGGVLFMPLFDVSINMISLFAFILVLGIVVDDAIVVGENIYTHRGRGKSIEDASVDGAIEVGRPVTFSVLSTIAAFTPLVFVSGVMGKFVRSIPIIVIAVLAVSLIESLFILPAHLNHRERDRGRGILSRVLRGMGRVNERVDRGLQWVIRRPYLSTVSLAVRYRYVTLALALVVMGVMVALFLSGRIQRTFMPAVEGDVVRARLVMPAGTPLEQTQARLEEMAAAATQVVQHYDRTMPQNQTILRGIYAIAGGTIEEEGARTGVGAAGAYLGEVAVFLMPRDERNVDSQEFVRRWRRLVRDIPGAEELELTSRIVEAGAPIAIQLAHDRFDVLRPAAARLKQRLSEYPGVFDVADSDEIGKRELRLGLRPQARSLGITARELAEQVQAAFFGAEALRLQRGRNEVKVMVRYPPSQRRNLADTDLLRIRTERGGEVPFAQAAFVDQGRGYSRIERANRQRTILVTADTDEETANAAEVVADLQSDFLPRLMAEYPGLSWGLEGEQLERQRSMQSLTTGFLVALGLIFVLLAIPFHSYSQPLIIMIAIPFGLIGAVVGHLLLGYDISLMSLFGVVALAGVVVNDSLVLVDFINRARAPGQRPDLAGVLDACRRRFRPVLLTTLTTFFALAPMLAERSVQARFLVPMAISLGFGVLFATGITLVLVPALYMVLDDGRRAWQWVRGRPEDEAERSGPGTRSSARPLEDGSSS